MKRTVSAVALFALSLSAGLGSVPSARGAWYEPGAFVDVQAQKGRPDARFDPPEREREARQERQERADTRRERMSEDERRSLHRDLDKANRELYGRRFPR